MKYPSQPLSEYIDIISGYAFKTKDFVAKGVPIIKIKNITPPEVNLNDLSFVSSDIADNLKKYELSHGDILIAMTGSHINQMGSVVGRIAKVKYTERTMLNQRVGKIVAKENADCCLDYVYHFLSQDSVKITLASKAGGAANQANISPSDIKALEIPSPPLPTQRRIAEILSTYDDLIENNQKQIKLLEEAAMLLYKEWFVKLRFPGHENAKIVDGVPKGWQKTVLGNVVNIKKGKNITKATVKTGVIPVVAGGIEPAYYHSLHNAIAPVVTISASGANAGFTNLYQENIWASDCSYISADETEHVYFYYLFLMVNKVEIHNMQKGAAQPHVYPKDLMSLSVLYPEIIILEQFSIVISQYFKKVSLLKQETQKARTARDKLLPKLICGEIEV